MPNPVAYESWDGVVPVTGTGAQVVLFMGVDAKPDRIYAVFGDLSLATFQLTLDAPTSAQPLVEALFHDQVAGGTSKVSLLKGPVPCCIPPVGEDVWAVMATIH